MQQVKSKEREKGMGGGLSSVVPVLLGAGLAFGLVFLLLLAVAALIWAGKLPTEGWLPAALCVGVSALVGGRFAVLSVAGRPLPVSVLTAGVLCIGLMALCILYGGTVAPSRGLFAMALLALAGGSLAGLMGRRKRRKRPGKR